MLLGYQIGPTALSGNPEFDPDPDSDFDSDETKIQQIVAWNAGKSCPEAQSLGVK